MIALAAVGFGIAQVPAGATVLTIDPSAHGTQFCRIATGGCASSDSLSIVGGVQQGLISASAYEYALPTLPTDAVIYGAYLSIGAYSRYGVPGFQGFRDEAIGTINLTSYAGDGVFEGADTDHRDRVDLTLVQARTTSYLIQGLVQSYLTSGNAYLGFSIYQSPPGVCGFGTRCEVLLTGDTVDFAFAFQPQLVIAYTQPPPPPPPGSATPEPTTWAMMVSGFGLIGAALRRRKPASRRAATA